MQPLASPDLLLKTIGIWVQKSLKITTRPNKCKREDQTIHNALERAVKFDWDSEMKGLASIFFRITLQPHLAWDILHLHGTCCTFSALPRSRFLAGSALPLSWQKKSLELSPLVMCCSTLDSQSVVLAQHTSRTLMFALCCVRAQCSSRHWVVAHVAQAEHTKA